GIDLVFYGKAGKDLPYGYTLIDHGKGRVYKGSDVLSLNELLQPLPALAVESGVGNIKVIVAAEGVAMPSDIEASSADFVDPDISISLDPQTPAFEQLKAFEAPLQISISEDIDDEAIHGRRRQRKKLRNQ
ncbi:MAG TPA: hypothetical protein VKB19_04270, partial [Pedobacter sp.]|nr:hypothetical protein [Pedobacter sp.]